MQSSFTKTLPSQKIHNSTKTGASLIAHRPQQAVVNLVVFLKPKYQWLVQTFIQSLIKQKKVLWMPHIVQSPEIT